MAEVFDHDLYQLKNKDGKLLKKRYNHQRLKQYFSSLRDTRYDLYMLRNILRHIDMNRLYSLFLIPFLQHVVVIIHLFLSLWK